MFGEQCSRYLGSYMDLKSKTYVLFLKHTFSPVGSNSIESKVWWKEEQNNRIKRQILIEGIF